MHRRASVLRTAQGVFASLPAAALLPAGRGTSRCRLSRSVLVAVDVYGGLLIIIVRPAGVGAWGKREWKDVESSRRRDS